MNRTMVAGIAAGGLLGVAVGVVTPSLASDNPTSSAAVSTTSATTTAAQARKSAHPGLAKLRNVIHATWVTRDGTRHRAIRGTVQAVSAGAITVKATDGVTETYTVTSGTVVRVLGDKHPGKDSISGVHVGDRALVAGKGASAASRVVAGPPKAATATS